MTAAVTTGPAKGPLPTSSIPAIKTTDCIKLNSVRVWQHSLPRHLDQVLV